MFGYMLVAIGVGIWAGGRLVFPAIVFWAGGLPNQFVFIQTVCSAAGAGFALIGVRIVDDPSARRALYLTCCLTILAVTMGRFALYLKGFGFVVSGLLFVLDIVIAAFFLLKSRNP